MNCEFHIRSHFKDEKPNPILGIYYVTKLILNKSPQNLFKMLTFQCCMYGCATRKNDPKFRKCSKGLKMNSRIENNTWVLRIQTSRFPYIGSSCVLLAVVTQSLMAAVCFQTLLTNCATMYAFIVLFSLPSHLGRLPIWVAFSSGSHCVGHIV